MTMYETAASAAAEFVERDGAEPRAAWMQAIEPYSESSETRRKSCPRVAFHRTLCETGMVRGIPAGTYSAANENRIDVQRVVNALRSDPTLADDKRGLWLIATDGVDKEHNGQMDVLQGLWRAGRLNWASGVDTPIRGGHL